MCLMAGRDAWSHAYQPGEIKNITQEQAIEYLVSRHIAKADAQELVKARIDCLLGPSPAVDVLHILKTS